MAGNAFSTRTGGAPSLASTPQTRVPVYTSFLRMMWTPFLDQSLPVGLAIPSSLRVRVTARIPLPALAMPKMRSTTAEFAYRAGYDGTGRVSVTHVVERGYSAMLTLPELRAA